jgi:serine/threonine protein kinase
LGLRPHPALPIVRDDFFLDDRYVLVMDWADGTSVAQIFRERGDPGMAVATVLDTLPVITDALDHLQHKPRVIHGDVRPENVIIAGDGRATLVFGVGTVFALAATVVYTLTCQPPAPGPEIAWEGVAPELANRLDRVLRRATCSPPRGPLAERMGMAGLITDIGDLERDD